MCSIKVCSKIKRSALWLSEGFTYIIYHSLCMSFWTHNINFTRMYFHPHKNGKLWCQIGISICFQNKLMGWYVLILHSNIIITIFLPSSNTQILRILHLTRRRWAEQTIVEYSGIGESRHATIQTHTNTNRTVRASHPVLTLPFRDVIRLSIQVLSSCGSFYSNTLAVSRRPSVGVGHIATGQFITGNSGCSPWTKADIFSPFSYDIWTFFNAWVTI